MKCQATTSEGSRCKFNASAEVGGKHFCGNHANIARATQLFDRTTASADEPHKPKPRGPAVFDSSAESKADAERMLKTLRALELVEAPDKVIVQMLQAWKAGDL